MHARGSANIRRSALWAGGRSSGPESATTAPAICEHELVLGEQQVPALFGAGSVCSVPKTWRTRLFRDIASEFDQALRRMEVALVDCPDDLWGTDLWPDEASTAPAPQGGLHGSAPWFLGYRALLTLDYDRAAEFGPWAPPQPFDENTYAFLTVRSPRPNSSVTSITAAGGSPYA